MQLRTKVGYRDLNCTVCKHHARCGDYLCECKEIWHQCTIHRIGPVKHKNQRSPKDAAQKRQQKEETKLDHRRNGPSDERNAGGARIETKNRKKYRLGKTILKGQAKSCHLSEANRKTQEV